MQVCAAHVYVLFLDISFGSLQRLTEPKLRSLYTDLKLQDKEELQFKQSFKDTDKDGTLEAKLRRQLINTMTNYDLLETIGTDDEVNPQKFKEPKKEKADNYRNKSLFKDKKLNNLWDKAEAAGFAAAELDALKTEFTHYQDKLDIYYSLVDSLDETIKDQYGSKCSRRSQFTSELCGNIFILLDRYDRPGGAALVQRCSIRRRGSPEARGLPEQSKYVAREA